MKKLVLVLLVSISIVFLDMVSKLAVINLIDVGTDIPIIRGIFSLTHLHNHGVAFGFLRELPDDFRVILISSIAICTIVLILVMIRNNASSKRVENCALALILGGAIGNLGNRLWLGYVTDFLDFHWGYVYHFPAFNIADTAICVGVAGIFFFSILQTKSNVA